MVVAWGQMGHKLSPPTTLASASFQIGAKWRPLPSCDAPPEATPPEAMPRMASGSEFRVSFSIANATFGCIQRRFWLPLQVMMAAPEAEVGHSSTTSTTAVLGHGSYSNMRSSYSDAGYLKYVSEWGGGAEPMHWSVTFWSSFHALKPTTMFCEVLYSLIQKTEWPVGHKRQTILCSAMEAYVTAYTCKECEELHFFAIFGVAGKKPKLNASSYETIRWFKTDVNPTGL